VFGKQKALTKNVSALSEKYQSELKLRRFAENSALKT